MGDRSEEGCHPPEREGVRGERRNNIRNAKDVVFWGGGGGGGDQAARKERGGAHT